MSKVRCTATCYMPISKGNKVVERYEDEDGNDVYEVPFDRVKEFLATGNFHKVD